MDSDVILVIGIVLAALSLPATLSAFAEGRAPRAAVFTAVIAGGMIVWAAQTHPGGYRLEDIPHAFVRVAAKYII